MIRKKICMLGAFSVGKTSLVTRFVKSIFSERYTTTVGVKILKKEVHVAGTDVNLVLWDLHGDDEFQNVRTSYLRGASGYLLVADGTRAGTLDRALQLDLRAREYLDREVPRVLLLNKADLDAEWELGDDTRARAEQAGVAVFQTSAKTGDGVDPAFLHVAGGMLEE